MGNDKPYKASTCMKCGKPLPKGWTNARCADCFNDLKQKRWKRAQAYGADVLDSDRRFRVKPPQPIQESESPEDDEPDIVCDKRLREYMEADDLHTEGVIKLMEALYGTQRQDIEAAYRAWVKSAMANENYRVIYNAELNYQSLVKPLLSPLWEAGGGSNPNEYLETIWQEVEQSLFRGNKVVERYIKKRMKDAREEAIRKQKEAQGRK